MEVLMATTHRYPVASATHNTSSKRQFKVYLRKDFDNISQLQKLTKEQRDSMKAVSAVLPFRVNNYVIEDLIDWNNIPSDPIFQLTFPQPGMLSNEDFQHMLELIRKDVSVEELHASAREIQKRMNPHPAGQMQLNVPHMGDELLEGMQHKYRETVLFFPAHGQTCHAYCSYCFRWAQFVGIDDLKFASSQANTLYEYVRRNTSIRSVLFTGGDPLVMKSNVLRKYIEPLLDPSLEHLESIRIGSKAPAYWPYKFVSDNDADDLLRLFEEVTSAGRNLTVMAHFTHPRELDTMIAQEAIRRMRSASAVVRCQAPIVRHVNDSAEAWTTLWENEVKLGAIPYYMFVERDTGAKNYFEIPLAKALQVFNDAYRQVSGLARTVRGPSMSATPGKVVVDGVTEINGEKVFVLKLLQGREPGWVGQIFFAKFDPRATWLDKLTPAFGDKEFFFEGRLRELQSEQAGKVKLAALDA